MWLVILSQQLALFARAAHRDHVIDTLDSNRKLALLGNLKKAFRLEIPNMKFKTFVRALYKTLNMIA